MVLDSVFMTMILRQSDPPSEIAYAAVLPSLEKLKAPKEVVASSEKVLGSKKTSAAEFPFLRYTTY